MTVECDAIGGVNLAQGVCDTPLPAPVLEAAIRAIQDGYNIYTRLDGIAVLRQAIAEKFEHYNGLIANPDTEILVTSGATGAMSSACLALFDPGDQVILFEPFYGYHHSTLLSMRVEPVLVPLADATWEIDFDRLRASITHAELLTPVDIEREFRISGGHWHHVDLAFDQFFMVRPLPGAAQHQTPVAGLYLCGAGCHPGGGVMGTAGRNAAQQVLKAA